MIFEVRALTNCSLLLHNGLTITVIHLCCSSLWCATWEGVKLLFYNCRKTYVCGHMLNIFSAPLVPNSHHTTYRQWSIHVLSVLSHFPSLSPHCLPFLFLPFSHFIPPHLVLYSLIILCYVSVSMHTCICLALFTCVCFVCIYACICLYICMYAGSVEEGVEQFWSVCVWFFVPFISWKCDGCLICTVL